ncbi:hypothetical protein BJX63DRAFT_433247 [Aspergillus granulosus]|uniref:Prion-inhibition and propagation HeLo domain-containing protein n=1 Tax=Aspergillus granulosus TaxID=176169 RepID=A0ABR4H807_9EURO
MDESISSLFVACYARLDPLLKSDALASRAHEVPLGLWEEELARLRIWAANIGAHQIGQSSLDYRLRDASQVRIQVTQLLHNLHNLLDDLVEVLKIADHGVSSDADADFDAYDESDVMEVLDKSDFQNLTDLQQIHKCVVEDVNCLYQMSMVIRRPAQHDRVFKIREEDAAPYRFFDYQHVSSKFPAANRDLVSRLGNAISKRRAILKYRERHRQKLAHGIDSVLQDEQSTAISDTVATNFEAGPGGPEDVLDTGSVTSYAPTLFDLHVPVDSIVLHGYIDHEEKIKLDTAGNECPYILRDRPPFKLP